MAGDITNIPSLISKCIQIRGALEALNAMKYDEVAAKGDSDIGS